MDSIWNMDFFPTMRDNAQVLFISVYLDITTIVCPISNL